MPPKSAAAKAPAKKRKTNQDPNQGRLTTFWSANSSLSASSSPMKENDPIDNDPMETDPAPQVKEVEHSATVNVSSLLGTFRQQSLVPRIVIQTTNPSRLKELPTDYFETSWNTQKKLIQNVFNTRDVGGYINYQTSAKLCENLCRFGQSNKLYDNVKQELEHHVLTLKAKLSEIPVNRNILERLCACWHRFCAQLGLLRNVFMELDRTYLLPNTKFSSLIQLGKHIFSETIMESSHFRGVIVAEVLSLIQQDRDNKPVDTQLIQSILHMMIELSFYNIDFEPRFLTSTERYYKDESDKLVHGLNVPDYIQHVSARQEQENERVKQYLDPHTKQALHQVTVTQLVYKKTEIIIKKGFKTMIDSNLYEPLKVLYTLLEPSDKLILLKNAFGAYVKEEGVSLISTAPDDKMVTRLLTYKAKMDTVLQCFDNNNLFQNGLKEGFEHLINTRGNKPAELLARYMDSKLKKRGGIEDVHALDTTLALFRYLQNKDVFETYYKRFLAKRLLNDRVSSLAFEKQVLALLQKECGEEFTKGLDSMFDDIETSQELNAAFGDPALQPKIISQAVWPSFPALDVVLPHILLSKQTAYERFYSSKYSGRKLIWQHSLATVTLVIHFAQGPMEVNLTLSQALLLLLFNDTNKKAFQFNDIMRATQLKEKDLARLLCTISTKPYNLLINESGGDLIKKTDKFRFNMQYTSSSPRLKVPPAQLDLFTVEETKVVEQKVFQNRQHQLDAAIVRIMKSKKRVTHTILVNEILSQLNYPVDAADMKKRIESLIDKDYMIRDQEDANTYIYQS